MAIGHEETTAKFPLLIADLQILLELTASAQQWCCLHGQVSQTNLPTPLSMYVLEQRAMETEKSNANTVALPWK